MPYGGEVGLLTFFYKKIVSIFQNVTRDHPSGGDDARPVSVFAAADRRPD
ncbi:MAG: hypothetical protein ACJAU6_004094 [Alphaproteobacteria bacterium]|jgi:hypothetical protein